MADLTATLELPTFKGTPGWEFTSLERFSPAAFTAAVVAAAVRAAPVAGDAMTMPPPPSPVMTGVAGELIEEFTVTSGFAYIDGGIT